MFYSIYIFFCIIIAFFTGLLSYKIAIPILQNYLQPIRTSGLKSHLKNKAAVPTFGGLIIVLLPIILCLPFIETWDFNFIYVFTIFISFATIGFVDDYAKILRKTHKGISGKIRFILEFSIALLMSYQLVSYGQLPTEIMFYPLGISVDFGMLYPFIAAFIITGSANAVNLTDGLDGLAIVPVNIVLITLTSLVALDMPSSDIIFIGLLIGTCMAFLWYNAYPAKIFMGDVGSLALGALLGAFSIIYKLEIILFIAGMLFVVETLSVILQVVSYKLRKKRIFLMAPIHHHFEKMGISETTIVIRAWLFTLACSSIAIICFAYNLK